MIPRRRSAKKNGRNLKKLQTDAQNPDSIGNLDRRPLTISLPSFDPIKAVHPQTVQNGKRTMWMSAH
jgi:hypothetical protein